ncbi:unnamed protein product [Effrenium voratum]|nr:unnamed protein product [Effrenium voratum]
MTSSEFQVEETTETEPLGGEPIKVEAVSPHAEYAQVSGSPALSPTAPVNLELPVKLLRLDHSPVQITQYEEEEEGQTEPSYTPADWIFNPSPTSDMLSDVWNSPEAWNPWFAMKMDMPFVGEHFEANAATPPENISHGSAMHGTGACKPCAWFWKPGSCQNKENCSYCHLCPEGELKARKKAKAESLPSMPHTQTEFHPVTQTEHT